MDADKLRELSATLEVLQRRQAENRLQHYAPYPKQALFHALGAAHRERLLCAGNQLGKTYSGAMEMAAHLTGRYPAWWTGRRFEGPIRAWASGVTSESVRDTVQRLLLGPLGAQGTGALPADTIVEVRTGRGLADAVDTVMVEHVSGRQSQLSFKSYEKGREKWQGESLQCVWFDEEPPPDIYSEGLARISARSGVTLLTFTPLLGQSAVVKRFFSEPSPDRAHVVMSIEDAEHISATERKRIEAGYSEHERDARIRGIPMLGSGRVYGIAESAISVPGFEIPGHFARICGIDFGWQNFAAVWAAWDRDADTLYITDCYKSREQTPIMHAAAIKARGDCPISWPHDGHSHDKGSGEALSALYRAQGLAMLPDRATFPDGGSAVEAGILDLLDRMQSGRFKVFSHLSDWFEELRVYHRKDGRIVKQDDHILDATRYAAMMLRHARTGSSRSRSGTGPRMASGLDYNLFDSEPERSAGGGLDGFGRPIARRRQPSTDYSPFGD